MGSWSYGELSAKLSAIYPLHGFSLLVLSFCVKCGDNLAICITYVTYVAHVGKKYHPSPLVFYLQNQHFFTVCLLFLLATRSPVSQAEDDFELLILLPLLPKQ